MLKSIYFFKQKRIAPNFIIWKIVLVKIWKYLAHFSKSGSICLFYKIFLERNFHQAWSYPLILHTLFLTFRNLYRPYLIYRIIKNICKKCPLHVYFQKKPKYISAKKHFSTVCISISLQYHNLFISIDCEFHFLGLF